MSEKFKTGIEILVGPMVIELLMKTWKILFWPITQGQLALLKVQCHCWVSKTICFRYFSKNFNHFWDTAKSMLNLIAVPQKWFKTYRCVPGSGHREERLKCYVYVILWHPCIWIKVHFSRKLIKRNICERKTNSFILGNRYKTKDQWLRLKTICLDKISIYPTHHDNGFALRIWIIHKL